MTVNTENTAEPVQIQEKTDATLSQQKPDTNTAQQQQTEDKPEDPNWKAFREARKQDRIALEAAKKRATEKEAEAEALKAAMEAAFARQPTNSVDNSRQSVGKNAYQNYYQNDSQETEDERIQKKVEAAMAQREQAYRQEQAQREQQEYPQRLQKTYADFNQTIANENLDYLDYHYPEVSGPLSMLPEGFEKWNCIYKAVKKFVPNGAEANRDSNRANNNLLKPKSMSGTSVTQPGAGTNSYRITEEKRAANWERMKKEIGKI
jgi:hypothetical protein